MRFLYDRKRDDASGTSVDLDQPAGANGGDSRRVLTYLRLRHESNPIAADILLLNCGLHDLRTDPATHEHRVPIQEYADNLRAILALAAADALHVVWMRITPIIERFHNVRCQKFHRFTDDVDAYNRTADDIMRSAGVPVIDLHDFTRQYAETGITDHVHFDEPTRERQAAFIAGALHALADRGAFPRLAPARVRPAPPTPASA